MVIATSLTQMGDRITDDELTEFVRGTEEAADAWVRGDMDRYLELIHHARVSRCWPLLVPGDATRGTGGKRAGVGR